MADELEVKFGADTSGIDAGTDRAVADVNSFSSTIDQLKSKLGGIAQSISQAFSGAGTGQADSHIQAYRQHLNELRNASSGFSVGEIAAWGGVATAIFAATSKLVDFGRQHSEVAQRISNLSQQLGFTNQETSQWIQITANAGVTSQQFASSVDQLARNYAQARSGVKRQSEAFEELGISTNEAMTSQQLLLAVADRLHTMPDGPEKTAIAMRVLGSAGAQLIPVLNGGAEAIRAQGAAAVETGAAVSDAYVNAGLEVNDSLNQMTQATEGLSNSMFESLSPAITSIVQGLADFTTDMAGAFKAGGDFHGVIVALDVVIRAISIVVGAAGVVIADVFAAAVIVCIPLVATLAGGIISLKRAFEGDFAGAARAWSESAQAGVRAIQGQVENARRVQEHYNQFVRNTVNGNNGHQAAPGLDPQQAAAGAAIIDRIRAQQDADAKRVADAQARREEAQRNAAARAAHRAAEQSLQAHLAELSAEQEADRDNYQQVMALEQQKLAALSAFYGQNSRQYQNELRRQEQMERQHNELLAAIAQDRAASHARIEENIANTDESIAQQRFAAQRAVIEQMRQLDEITEQERIARLRAVDQQEEQEAVAHENRLYALHLATLQQSLQDETLRPQERERINRQIEELEAAHQQKMRQLQETAAQNASATQRSQAAAAANSWRGILQPVGQAFNGMFQNLYNGTMGLKQAFLQALDQMLFALVQKGIEMAVNWAANQLAMTAATTAGVTTRTAAEETGAATSIATSGSVALADIANSAFRAAAGAYAAISSIPVVGPFLAPAIAAGILASVIGFAGSIVSSRGGLGKVDKDGQMAELHKDETVLPASMAVPLRDMLSNWSVGESSLGLRAQASGGTPPGGNYVGGDTNLTYAPSNQVGSGNLETQLKRDSLGMRRWLKNEVRNGRIKV